MNKPTKNFIQIRLIKLTMNAKPVCFPFCNYIHYHLSLQPRPNPRLPVVRSLFRRSADCAEVEEADEVTRFSPNLLFTSNISTCIAWNASRLTWLIRSSGSEKPVLKAVTDKRTLWNNSLVIDRRQLHSVRILDSSRLGPVIGRTGCRVWRSVHSGWLVKDQTLLTKSISTVHNRVIRVVDRPNRRSHRLSDLNPFRSTTDSRRFLTWIRSCTSDGYCRIVWPHGYRISCPYECNAMYPFIRVSSLCIAFVSASTSGSDCGRDPQNISEHCEWLTPFVPQKNG